MHRGFSCRQSTSYLHIDSQKHFVQHNGVRWAHVEYGSDNGETKQPTWSCSQCNDVESLCQRDVGVP